MPYRSRARTSASLPSGRWPPRTADAASARRATPSSSLVSTIPRLLSSPSPFQFCSGVHVTGGWFFFNPSTSSLLETHRHTTHEREMLVAWAAPRYPSPPAAPSACPPPARSAAPCTAQQACTARGSSRTRKPSRARGVARGAERRARELACGVAAAAALSSSHTAARSLWRHGGGGPQREQECPTSGTDLPYGIKPKGKPHRTLSPSPAVKPCRISFRARLGRGEHADVATAPADRGN